MTYAPPEYRILVTGSRIWTDGVTIATAISSIPILAGVRPVVVHGACRSGADALADIVADRLGMAVERHPAIWRPHGIYNPHAGLVRNRQMVELGADICLAFIVGNSRGASHCARLAEEAGIPTRRYDS